MVEGTWQITFIRFVNPENVNPRLPEPFFETRLPEGGGVVTTPPVNLKLTCPKYSCLVL